MVMLLWNFLCARFRHPIGIIWRNISGIANACSWCFVPQINLFMPSTHKYISELTIIGSDNGLLPFRRQVIIWPKAGIFWIGPLETKLNVISIEIHAFSSFRKMRLKLSSVKWWPFCIGLSVLTTRSCILVQFSTNPFYVGRSVNWI